MRAYNQLFQYKVMNVLIQYGANAEAKDYQGFIPYKQTIENVYDTWNSAKNTPDWSSFYHSQPWMSVLNVKLLIS